MTLNVNISPPGLQVDFGNRGLSTGFDNPILRETVVTEGSLPLGGSPGDVLLKKTVTDFDAEWVAPANHAEEDNTRPITAAAVYTEIGNINALLATI